MPGSCNDLSGRSNTVDLMCAHQLISSDLRWTQRFLSRIAFFLTPRRWFACVPCSLFSAVTPQSPVTMTTMWLRVRVLLTRHVPPSPSFRSQAWVRWLCRLPARCFHLRLRCVCLPVQFVDGSARVTRTWPMPQKSRPSRPRPLVSAVGCPHLRNLPQWWRLTPTAICSNKSSTKRHWRPCQKFRGVWRFSGARRARYQGT